MELQAANNWPKKGRYGGVQGRKRQGLNDTIHQGDLNHKGCGEREYCLSGSRVGFSWHSNHGPMSCQCHYVITQKSFLISKSLTIKVIIASCQNCRAWPCHNGRKSIQHSLENALLQTSTLELFCGGSFPCDIGLDISSVVRGHLCNNLSGRLSIMSPCVSPAHPHPSPHNQTYSADFLSNWPSKLWAGRPCLCALICYLLLLPSFTPLKVVRQRIENDTFNFKPCCQ